MCFLVVVWSLIMIENLSIIWISTTIDYNISKINNLKLFRKYSLSESILYLECASCKC